MASADEPEQGWGWIANPYPAPPQGLATPRASGLNPADSESPHARAHARFSHLTPPPASDTSDPESLDTPTEPKPEVIRPGDLKPDALRNFAARLNPDSLRTVTLVAPGFSTNELWAAIASLWRFLAKLGCGPLLLLEAREQGSQAHVHGIIAEPFPSPAVLLEGWKRATRRKNVPQLARRVDARPIREDIGGLLGWLRYSARGVSARDLGAVAFASGQLGAQWATGLESATIANPKRCGWCLALLDPARAARGAEYCERKGSCCLESASRERSKRRRAAESATIANPFGAIE